VRLARRLILEGVEDPERRLVDPDQTLVPGSRSTIPWPALTNASTSASLPGFAWTNATIPSVSAIGCLLDSW
jgi:hypothetical protein